MKSPLKTYRAVIAPWRLNSIRWPLVSRTVGKLAAIYEFRSGTRRLIVTTA